MTILSCGYPTSYSGRPGLVDLLRVASKLKMEPHFALSVTCTAALSRCYQYESVVFELEPCLQTITMRDSVSSSTIRIESSSPSVPVLVWGESNLCPYSREEYAAATLSAPPRVGTTVFVSFCSGKCSSGTWDAMSGCHSPMSNGVAAVYFPSFSKDLTDSGTTWTTTPRSVPAGGPSIERDSHPIQVTSSSFAQVVLSAGFSLWM